MEEIKDFLINLKKFDAKQIEAIEIMSGLMESLIHRADYIDGKNFWYTMDTLMHFSKGTENYPLLNQLAESIFLLAEGNFSNYVGDLEKKYPNCYFVNDIGKEVFSVGKAEQQNKEDAQVMLEYYKDIVEKIPL